MTKIIRIELINKHCKHCRKHCRFVFTRDSRATVVRMEL